MPEISGHRMLFSLLLSPVGGFPTSMARRNKGNFFFKKLLRGKVVFHAEKG